jgi:hypothetical protein
MTQWFVPIALFARTVDRSDQFRQRCVPVMRDFFQVSRRHPSADASPTVRV